MNNPEAKLARRVADWIRSKGYIVYAEVPSSGGRSIDLVGIKGTEIITIELKVAFSTEVMRQSMLNQLITKESWAAAPRIPKHKTIAAAKQYGIGLLSIGEYFVSPVCSPRSACRVQITYADAMLAHCKLDCPSDRGGLKSPPLARTVHARILLYLQTHPSAGWVELYRNIPNHYLHSRSMMQAMRALHDEGLVAERIQIRKSKEYESTDPDHQ